MGVVDDANDIDTIEIIATYKHGTNGHASEPNSADKELFELALGETVQS